MALSRFFAADSFWNQPLPPDPPLHAKSREWIDLITREVGEGLHINIRRWSIPVYEADESTPMREVRDAITEEIRLTGSSAYVRDRMDPRHFIGQCPGFSPVPIPSRALPDSQSDAHLAIVAPHLGRAWDMWRVTVADDGTLTSHTGMTYELDGSGLFERELALMTDPPTDFRFGPSRAAGVPTIAGLIMAHEVAAGRIGHRLAFACQTPAAQEFVYPPATWTDGAWPGGIPQGSIVFLNPKLDLSRFHLSPGALVVARALQEYGAVCVDFAGAPVLYGEGRHGPDDRRWEGLLDESALASLPRGELRVAQHGTLYRDGADPTLNRAAWTVRERGLR